MEYNEEILREAVRLLSEAFGLFPRGDCALREDIGWILEEARSALASLSAEKQYPQDMYIDSGLDAEF